MEVVGEGKNRRELLKLVDGGEEDRISALPDCLILEILSRLPTTKYAIRTGALSKRWKHCWTSVTTLIFKHSGISTQCLQNPNSISDFVSFVDKTLTQRRQLKLKKFVVYTDYDIQFESQFNNWIRYTISCNVEELDLQFLSWDEAEFVLDQFFFVGSSFTHLTLENCILNPTEAISWKNLRSLSIGDGKLSEELIENILFGSPVLETLVLDRCYGFRLLNITSKSVKNLVFSGYSDPDDGYDLDDIIEINAPNILSLSIEGALLLRKLLLLNVSSLVEANLDYEKLGDNDGTTRKESREEMLKGFILKLCHVKVLKIGSFCAKVVSHLEAKGFVFPSNISKFPEITCSWSDSDTDSDHDE